MSSLKFYNHDNFHIYFYNFAPYRTYIQPITFLSNNIYIYVKFTIIIENVARANPIVLTYILFIEFVIKPNTCSTLAPVFASGTLSFNSNPKNLTEFLEKLYNLYKIIILSIIT